MAVAVMNRFVLGLAAWAACQGAWALGSAAPFTPPDHWSGDATAAAATDASASATADTPAPRLTGVRQGPRSAALIDGEWVDVGQAIGTARLLAVNAQGAQLKHPDGRREFLALNPDVRWTPQRPPMKTERRP